MFVDVQQTPCAFYKKHFIFSFALFFFTFELFQFFMFILIGTTQLLVILQKKYKKYK